MQRIIQTQLKWFTDGLHSPSLNAMMGKMAGFVESRDTEITILLPIKSMYHHSSVAIYERIKGLLPTREFESTVSGSSPETLPIFGTKITKVRGEDVDITAHRFFLEIAHALEIDPCPIFPDIVQRTIWRRRSEFFLGEFELISHGFLVHERTMESQAPS